MFKRKKIVTLCAATLAGVSAMTSLVPMVTFADATKEGQTTVAYEGAPKPAEWGLSVPVTLELDKKSTGTAVLNYADAKLAIVKEDGSNYSDDSKDHVFSVSGTSNFLTGETMQIGDDKVKHELFVYPLGQGVEPNSNVRWTNLNDASVTRITDLEIHSKADGSLDPSRYVQFAVNRNQADVSLKDGNKYSSTITWTATEKTS